MKIISVMIVAGCAVLAGLNAVGQDPVDGKASSPPTKAKPRWVPAVYRGLVMGKSSRADALKVLGQPTWTGKEEASGTPMMTFNVSEPIAGRLSVLLDHDIVFEVRLTPKESYTKSDITKILGPGSITVHYASADCLAEDGMGGPMYEDPNGDFEFVEYRPRGIAVDIQKDGTVGEISFVKGPLGSLHSPCPAGWNNRASYYPLAVGNWWLYTVKESAKKKITTVKWEVIRKEEDTFGPHAYQLSSTPAQDDTPTFLAARENGIVDPETENVALKSPLHTGDRWNDQHSVIHARYEAVSAGKACAVGGHRFRAPSFAKPVRGAVRN